MFGYLCSMVVTKYPASCNVFLLGHTLHMHVNREVDKELWRSMARLERMKFMEFLLIGLYTEYGLRQTIWSSMADPAATMAGEGLRGKCCSTDAGYLRWTA